MSMEGMMGGAPKPKLSPEAQELVNRGLKVVGENLDSGTVTVMNHEGVENTVAMDTATSIGEAAAEAKGSSDLMETPDGRMVSEDEYVEVKQNVVEKQTGI